jgi:uncharacterized protein (TIGR03382 family)
LLLSFTLPWVVAVALSWLSSRDNRT